MPRPMRLAQLESGVEGYILSGSDLLPGNVAKTMLAVQVAGGDVDSFGGHDLEADLRSLLITTPARISGGSGPRRTPTRRYAILALSRTSGGAPSESVDWLVAAQCSNGDFQWDGSCPGAGAEDPDTTALALQALLAGGRYGRGGDLDGPAARHPGLGRIVQLVRHAEHEQHRRRRAGPSGRRPVGCGERRGVPGS